MRPTPVLVGAGVAAVLLTAAAAVQGGDVPDCGSARAARDAANSLHQDALATLDRAVVRARRDGEGAGVPAARLLTEQAKADLDATRAAVALLCLYPNPGAPALATSREEPP